MAPQQQPPSPPPPPSSPPPPPPFTIAIIGAGITGTTLSIALAARNIPHAVYEQAAAPTEVGAGLGFGPNAARALRIIDARLHDEFRRVCAPSGGEGGAGRGRGRRRSGGGSGHGALGVQDDQAEPERGGADSLSRRADDNGGGDVPVWIEFLDGTSPVDARQLDPAFTVYATGGEGHGAVHRAKWLDRLMGFVPEGVVKFGKRLEDVWIGERGKMVMSFADRTTAEADAVVGCDGVKSRVREIMLRLGGWDVDVTKAKCGYSGKYAYRCMIPMEKAVQEIGWRRASVSSLWMGYGRHVLTFPVGKPGPTQLLNLVAFVTDKSGSWPSRDATCLTLPATREDALRDFREGGFGETVRKLLQLTQDKMDKWGLFDLAHHPLPSFYSGRVLVTGDAAHASTPHHGSGAGFCMEDVAVLACLFEQLSNDIDRFKSVGDGLEAVFAAFDESRRKRDQWLVESSRRAACLYEWQLDNMGKDSLEAMRRDIEERQGICWSIDLNAAIQKVKETLGREMVSY
ncbi:Salicylate hydroxylase [Madurella fahalii]|uniref:Salicylate hydroxylase n=1 Tax=Madurella fahalii TaxID=1157608 RepID=A0ABQ0GGR8_9PEZI